MDPSLCVVLSERAFKKLSGYVAACAGTEVSCLGTVKREGSRFLVEEFFLVAQEGSSASTEMDADALAETVAGLCAHGRSDEASRLKCWAHSHPDMGLFWSRTDEETCRGLCSDWLVSVVVDENCRALARVDVFQPLPATFGNVPVFARMDLCPDTLGQCRKEVQEKVNRGPERRPSESPRAGRLAVLEGGEDNGKFASISRFCHGCGSWHRRGECPMPGQDGRAAWMDEAEEDGAFEDEDAAERLHGFW